MTVTHKRLVVTGATGHTGRRLTRRLIELGHDVRILTRAPEKAREVFGAEPGVEVAVGDLEAPETVLSALDGRDALISVSHVRFASVLVDACRFADVRRAVFLSSARRYPRFADPPAEQVREGEAVIRRSGLDFTILRPTMIFGGPDDQNLARLLPFIRKCPIIPMPGGGLSLVQPTFVLDLVEAIIKSLGASQAIGNEYDIGGAEAMTLRAMVTFMARAMGLRRPILSLSLGPALWLTGLYGKCAKRPFLTRDQLQRLAEDKAVDITPARRDLDYAPTPFEAAMALKLAGKV